MKLGLTSTSALVRAEPIGEALPDAFDASENVGPQSSVRHKAPRLPSMTLMQPASPPAKKERNALETKRRILSAAAAEFAAKGFDGARLGSIARAATVQQALIHHYFADKEGLHREVVRGGLAAMTEGAWELLSRMDPPDPSSNARVARPTSRVEARRGRPSGVAPKAKKKGRASADLRALAEAFVDLVLRFFATNGAFLAILRHEARRGPDATKIVTDNVGPVFDAIVARLDAMRARGEVKKDVDARHLVLSCVAMIAFPFQEEPFVSAIWPADWHGEAFLQDRKKQVVEMILARVLP